MLKQSFINSSSSYRINARTTSSCSGIMCQVCRLQVPAHFIPNTIPTLWLWAWSVCCVPTLPSAPSLSVQLRCASHAWCVTQVTISVLIMKVPCVLVISKPERLWLSLLWFELWGSGSIGFRGEEFQYVAWDWFCGILSGFSCILFLSPSHPPNLPEAKLKCFGSVALAEDISK